MHRTELEVTYLQVVCMLPHVDAEDGNTLGDGVLVLRGDNGQAVRFIFDEPAPATASDAEKSSVESRLELVESAPDFGDLRDQLRGRVGAGVGARRWREVFPEKRVVDVATAMEVESSKDTGAGI